MLQTLVSDLNRTCRSIQQQLFVSVAFQGRERRRWNLCFGVVIFPRELRKRTSRLALRQLWLIGLFFARPWEALLDARTGCTTRRGTGPRKPDAALKKTKESGGGGGEGRGENDLPISYYPANRKKRKKIYSNLTSVR